MKNGFRAADYPDDAEDYRFRVIGVMRGYLLRLCLS
jgi:hypothetical protein